jgi:predicted NAD-dependent protein-ADP-ribosyltransferase YbiA (DUF1768 family)
MDTFVFYSKSADVAPGKGKGSDWQEHVSDPRKYEKLIAIKNWRKMFSNFWEESFVIDNHRWNSVEHYYHATKFREKYPDFYYSFSLDSNLPWSKDPVKAKSYGRAGKTITTNKRLKIDSNIAMRSDFYDGIDIKAMTVALYAKFSQNPYLREALISSSNAKLYHLVTRRGKKSELQHWPHLERIRECLKIYPEPVIFTSEIMDEILQKNHRTWQLSMGQSDCPWFEKFLQTYTLPYGFRYGRGKAKMIDEPKIGDKVIITCKARERAKGTIIGEFHKHTYIGVEVATILVEEIISEQPYRKGQRRNWTRIN